MKLLKQLILNSYVGIFLLSLFLSIVFTFPSTLSIGTRYIGDGGDNYEYASYQSIVARNIENGRNPLSHTDFWRFPVGLDLSRSFDSYLTVIPGGILSLFLSQPLSYNIIILTLMALNGLFSYMFFKRITKSQILGIAGMIIYGFSFYTLAKATSHPNLLFIGGFPLLALSCFNLIFNKEIKWHNFLLFFLSILILSISSLQYLLFILIIIPIVSLLALAVFKKDAYNFFLKIGRNISKSIIPFLLFVSVFIFLFFPRMLAFIQGKVIILDRYESLLKLSPALLDYVLPNSYLTILPAQFITSGSDPSIEKIVFLGFIELVFFTFFLFSNIDKRIKLFFTLLIALFFILSLGFVNVPTPYKFLFSVFPFHLIVETGRFAVIFYLFLTLGILLFLKSQENKKNFLFLVIILIALAILERIPAKFYTADTFKNETYQEIVRSLNSSAVMDIPINMYDPTYNILSFEYNKPIINGYFHWSSDGAFEKSLITDRGLISRYSCSDFDDVNTFYDGQYEEGRDTLMIDLLKKTGIRTLVLHKKDKFYHPVCRNVRVRIARLFPFEYTAAPTSDTQEKQIRGSSITGVPIFNIYLPYDGTFYLDGLYYSPSEVSDLKISINKQAPEFSYSFINGPQEHSKELSPKFSISFNVRAGSIIELKAGSIIENSSFSLWYRYTKEGDNYKPRTSYFEKIFEDDGTIVYHLN